MEKISLKDVDLNGDTKRQIELNTGLEKEGRKQVSDLLGKALANSYALMVKTQNYHWNIRGLHFKSIHELTEEHYNELFEAIDDLAERIRALGFDAPGSFPEFNNLTNISDPKPGLSELEMVADLLKSHEYLINNLRDVLRAAEKIEDEVTVDMMVDRLTVHEKAAWMLRSMIEH
ncbi:MAG: DNA starvation/stationary phase protection protein [Bacteroidota bacterium]|nr:DNA starvation/stationary phase protection protein [Bacteroidota bacterium]MDX5448911.1 DNA starvation/stationary phase protection protein [Bacteroidota bacterium]MDX5506127.1 DNA starvation/stationary phase protection protein [Bacteroidota bacterium]